MRVRYSGSVEAGVPGVDGLWQPGEEREVTRAQGTYLLHSSQFTDVADAPTDAAAPPEPGPTDTAALTEPQR